MTVLETQPCCDFCVIQVTKDRVFLIDLDIGRRSVTNDAEAVIAWVQRHYPGRRLIYRDSMGRWDEICVCYDNAVRFLPYTEELPNAELIESL